MKAFFIIFLLQILPLIAEGQNTATILLEEGDSIENLIPTNWKLLSAANGDLNADGRSDVAFVIEKTDKNNLVLNEGGIGRDTINQNPRIIGIYFSNEKGKFLKQLQSNRLIVLQDSPTMDEPFQGLEILENGELKVDFHFWYSAGSWSTSWHTYHFKYQNDQFDLIGYHSEERHRGSGEATSCKINFLTRAMTIWRTTIDENDKETTEETLKYFKLEVLKSIQTLGTPFQWELNGFYL